LPSEIVDEIDARSEDRAEFIRNIISEVRRNDYKVNSTEINKEIGEIKPVIVAATAEFKDGQISTVAKKLIKIRRLQVSKPLKAWIHSGSMSFRLLRII